MSSSLSMDVFEFPFFMNHLPTAAKHSWFLVMTWVAIWNTVRTALVDCASEINARKYVLILLKELLLIFSSYPMVIFYVGPRSKPGYKSDSNEAGEK